MRLFSLTTALTLALTSLTTAAELGIETTHQVECTRKTTKGDVVHMHYRGTLASDGSQFDASYDRGTPLKFPLGGGRVIKGWDEGLLDMCVGEKRTLTIPPEYGYGDRGVGPIPGGATLIFETELVEIEGVSKDEL
ncbi:Peptidyl-prolyl cis-trans isomerase fpr2 [Aspergillus nanangensis]|uniref:peptidylprolyl isomerase n=1 Tax=Aspergillus nanangensis TaxID=2582783 RepID=A0AAD4CD74_ASPNN|nr:Peptidyl-prolyl cis-trans isomerase fpr2 [Aspergillus nanangensis]